MKRSLTHLSLLLLLAAPLTLRAQIVNLTFPAGSPEDQASQAVDKETDAAKRTALLNDFVQKFAANPMAVAYGNSQMAQQLAASGDAAGALAASEKAYAAVPNNFEIIMTAANSAQQAKNWGKVVEYGAKGGTLFNAIGKQKPAEMSDADFANQSQAQRQQFQQQYDFLEASAFNAMGQESSAKARMGEIDAFTGAFPKSKFSESLAQLAIYSLSELKDSAGLAAYADKAVAANPDSVATLAMLANAFSEEQSGAHLVKATEYAHRAIELANNNKDKSDANVLLAAGLAHYALGYALLRQDGITAPRPGPRASTAIAELKLASGMLKSNPAADASALYWLGSACAKGAKFDEAQSALTDAAAIPGPYQQPARDLLAKVNSARSKAR